MNMNKILSEQVDNITNIRRAILEKKPISIYYRGPQDEVREGQRNDIFPVVMGRNAKSGNMVIWAFVFKGVSKRGLPGWKMFRLDRVVSSRFNENLTSFDVKKIPQYVKDKAPGHMGSLSSVEVYSPYWDDQVAGAQDEPEILNRGRDDNEPVDIEEPVQPPEETSKGVIDRVGNELRNNVERVDGNLTITQNQYDSAVMDIYRYKEGEFKKYQRSISGNEKPGSGTRDRFKRESENDVNNILSKNNIKVENPNEDILNEIKNRFKELITL